MIGLRRRFRGIKRRSGKDQISKSTERLLKPPDNDIGVAGELRKFFAFLAVATLISCSQPASAGEPAKDLAKVNDVPVTVNEVEEEVNRIIFRTLYHQDASPEQRQALRKEALERVIERELAYQEAKRRGLTVDRETRDERVEQVKKRFPSEKAFKEALSKSNLTLSQYEESVERELIMEKIFRAEVDEKAQVEDAEVRDYYEKNKDKFREPENIKLRHIAVLFDPSKGDEEKEKARARAAEILKRVRAGEDFAILATKYSEDAYKEKGGDLGYIGRGMMGPEIEKAAFGLAAGETMGTIETEYGFYIIKVEDRRPERQRAFDEVEERITKELGRKKKEERRTAWIKSLRDKAKIEYQGVGQDK